MLLCINSFIFKTYGVFFRQIVVVYNDIKINIHKASILEYVKYFNISVER